MASQEGLTTGKENFSEWYTQIITKAELIEYGPVSGCMVIRPYAYQIWEKVQEFLNKEFAKLGVKNCYFPMLIPESLLTKEADHIEGFAPEVAWVTQAGSSKLDEKLGIRPTSETIMYEIIGKWIRSHRDLPLLLNQWTNVLRWEFNHPTPFIRNREFLWQEGHTAHATKEEAHKEAQIIAEIYLRVYEELFATTGVIGRKSPAETFAGADYSLSVETLFPNGKALQACTSHHLGQNFSKPFEITFLDEDQQQKHVWQNSWGLSTRSIAALIGNHGDDKGLVLPPRVAPIKAVIVPITIKKKPELSAKVLEQAHKIADNTGAHLDDRDGYSPGYKFNEWELKGVPIRIELGPRDLENDKVVMVRRDTGEKVDVSMHEVKTTLTRELDEMQTRLLQKEKSRLDESIIEFSNLEELKKIVEEGKIGKAAWSATPESEEEIKKATGAKSLNGTMQDGLKCFQTGTDATGIFYFGKSY